MEQKKEKRVLSDRILLCAGLFLHLPKSLRQILKKDLYLCRVSEVRPKPLPFSSPDHFLFSHCSSKSNHQMRINGD